MEKQNPLTQDPITDEHYTLTDPAQLRRVIKALCIQIEAAAASPMALVRYPTIREALEKECRVLHAVVCDDCAEHRTEENIQPSAGARDTLKQLFLSLVQIEAVSQAQTDQRIDAEVDFIMNVLRRSAAPHLN